MPDAPVSRSLHDRVEIAPGVRMARLGLGTYKSAEGADVEGEIAYGLELGYGHVDTAALYGNEAGVGRALRASGVPRDEYTVATKVWNSDQGYRGTLEAFERSLETLGLEYVDLYLVHWPLPALTAETWRAMEEVHASGRARAIGVCNFLVHHLEDLLSFSEVPPALDQVEHHVRLQQPDLTAPPTGSRSKRGRRSCAGA
jgi:diketogulonate reductase-like aldo/keto reductase